jgi:L-glutamine-phosphate cytidylyltransferase
LNSIILAAGEGKRLKPLTNTIPKCLVSLFGQTLLQRQIDLFKQTNILDISVVTGYHSNKIKSNDITIFENPNFHITNMIETLFCAKEKLLESTIISYSDIIFEKSVLDKLIESKYDISIIVDLGWREYWESRFETPLDDAESLLIDDDGFLAEIGQKVDRFDKIQGQYIGLMKFQNNGIKYLKNSYERAKKQSEIGQNPLNSKLPFAKSYMTDLLNQMIIDGCNLRVIPITHGWLELDSYDDYLLYEKLHKSNKLSKFINLIKK